MGGWRGGDGGGVRVRLPGGAPPLLRLGRGNAPASGPHRVCEEKAPCLGPRLLVLGGGHRVRLPAPSSRALHPVPLLTGKPPRACGSESDWGGCEPWAGVGMEVAPRERECPWALCSPLLTLRTCLPSRLGIVQSPGDRNAPSSRGGGKWAQCRPPRALLPLSALAQGGPALLLSVSWLDCKFSEQGWCPVELCLRAGPDIRVLSTHLSLQPSPPSAPASLPLL